MSSCLSPRNAFSPRRGLRVSFQVDILGTNSIKPVSLDDDDDNGDDRELLAEKTPTPLVEAVLENELSKEVVKQHRSSLRHLVAEQRDSLSVLSNRTNNSSLRTLLSSATMDHDRSLNMNNWSGKHLETSTTEVTEDLTEFSFSEDYPNMFSDFESDQQEWGSITGGTDREEDDGGDNDSASFDVPQPVKAPAPLSSSTNKPNENASEIEVTPGVFMPLRGSTETWQAIKSGCTISTDCTSCKAKLHVIEDAALVVCQDCWMVSPVTQRFGDIPIEFDGGSETHGVGLGVKGEDVLEWMKSDDSSNVSESSL